MKRKSLLGNSYEALGEYIQALKYYLISLEIAKKLFKEDDA